MTGEVLSHFKILEKLGQGGMGIVYRGLDLDLDRPVAIKLLSPEAQQDEGSVARFLREARTASRLQHPAITTIFEFGVKDDQRYLVMEFVQGRTLREILRDGPLPVRRAVDIGIEIADALSVADDAGIIHRDIKPDNIMVTPRGKVKILDFGLAKMKERTGLPMNDVFRTQTGQVLGTVSYMSPEQAQGEELDTRTDIYSLGVVLFEMVTGTLPFKGKTPHAVMAGILKETAPAASSLNPAVPQPLTALIARCLEKEPDRRPATGGSLGEQLSAIREGRDSTETQSQSSTGTAVASQSSGEQSEASVRQDSDPVFGPSGPSSGPAILPGAAGSKSSGQASEPGGQSSDNVTFLAAAVQPDGKSRGTPEAEFPRVAAPRIPEQPPLSRLETAWRQEASFTLGLLRHVVAAGGWVYIIACIAVFIMPVLPAGFRVSPAFYLSRHLLDPILLFVVEVFGLSFTWQQIDFRVLFLMFIIYILKNVAVDQILRFQALIREPMLGPAKRGMIQPLATAAPAERRGTRMSLLRDYAVAKRLLGEVKKELAFLSVDVANAAELKEGEEKVAIEQAFGVYRRMVDRVVRECRPHKTAWTADGFMSCFPLVEDAALAARRLLQEVDVLNRGDHYLRHPFRLRCGINLGMVLLPHDGPLENLSDVVVDVAGHLQKNAEPDSVYITAEAYFRLLDRAGFTRAAEPLDNHDVFCLRKTDLQSPLPSRE